MLANAVSCVKGEVHNVVSMLRLSSRWGSTARFEREVPLESASALMRDFALVQDSLQGLQDLAGVDCLSYLKPFLDTIVSERASGPITGTALASVNKFLLYGFLRPDVPRAREAIVAVAAAATRCKFESSSVREDETTLMQILEVLRNCIRCPAGTLLTDESVWDMCGSAYRISRFEDASHLLHRSAESTLAHLVLTIFSRVPEIADEVEDRLEAAGEGGSDPGAGGASGSAASAPEGGDQGRSLVPAAPAPHPAKGDAGTWKAIELGAGPDRLAPYGEKALVKLLSWLSSLTEPATQPAHTRVLGLRLVNMVLESAGADMGRLPSLVRVATAELCRNLVQNSRTTEPAVLALTFRVVYSLFASLTQHLKVPLEVFFVSVHLSLVDSRDAPPENRELALEALLEFARDGELMADIFVNYDCSVRSTNLFEIFTGTLARNAVPSSGERLNSLHVLALEGVLAVLESLARRCELAARAGVAGALDTTTGDGPDAVPDDSPMAAAASWADSSDPRVEALRRRRQLKRRFALAAARFNACDGKHDEGDAGWLRYATQLGVLPVPEVADGGLAMEGAAAAADGAACGADDQEEELPGEEGPVTALDGALRPGDVARFLRTCPGLDRGHIGEYIAARADPRKPRTLFQSAVRGAFVRSFDFRGLNIVTALRAFLEAFRLPGESQMIERLMEDFSGRLFAQSPWPYSDQDAIFVFAYSIIMLTTDQHNDQVMRKMTLDDFVRNNRGINGGQDLPAELLAEVYADVQRRPLALHSDATEVAARPAAAGAADGHAPASGRAAGGSGASDAGGTSADGTGAGGAANGASTGAEAEEAAKAREKRLAALGDHWDGVLRRQLRVSEFATGQAPAGAHEGEMLAVIGNGALAAIASACESTQSEETLRHALEGIRHLALASALRGQQTLLDRAISAAAGFARRSVREAAALDAWVVRAPSAVPATMPAEAVPGAGGTEVAAAASRGGGALLSAADVGFEDIEAPDGRRLPSERFEGTRAADGRVTKAAKRIRRPIEQLATAVMAQQRRRSRGASMESIHSSGLGVHGAAASPARGAGGKVGADPDARAAAAARRAAASLSVALAWVGGASPASVAATAMATRDRRFAAAWVRFARQVASERVGPRRRAMLCGPAADGWSMASEVRPWDSAEQRALMALAGLRALAPRAAEAAASCLATELGARPAGEDNGAVEWPQGEAGEDAAALVSALLERAEAVAAAAVLHGDDEDSVADERTDELLASLRSHAWTKDAGSASSSALAGVGDRSSGAHGLAGGEWTDLSDDDSDEQDGGEHARPRQGAAASRAAAEVASGAGASPVGSGAEGESDGDDSDGTRKAGPRSGLFSMLFGADAPAPAQAGHRSSNAAVAASIAAECARAAHALGRVVVPGSAEAAALGDGPLGDTLPDGALEALVAAASRSALAGLASAISPARSREERSGSAAPTSSGAQATLSSAVLCVEVLGQASLRPGGACRPEIWRRPLLDVLAEAADCIERIGPSRRRREGTAAALGDVASHTTEGDVVAAEATEPSDGGGDVAAGASSLGPPAAWWPGDGLHEAAMSSETRGRRRETPSAPAARPPSLRDGRVRTTRPVASEAGFLLERAATLVLLAATRMTARADPAVPAARKRNARILARWCAAASGPDGHAQADAADASGPEQAVELVRVVVVPMLAAIAALPDTAMDVVAPRTAVGVGMLMQAGAGYVTDAGFWTLAWDVLCRCRSRFFAAPAAWHAASLAAEALEACGPHSAARAVRFFAPALTTAAPETFVAASAAWLGIAADQRLARRPEHGSSEAASLIAAFSKAGGARGLPFYADVAARAMGHPVFELRRRVGWEACRIITRLLAGLPAASADGAGDWRAAWALVLQAATWSTQEAANSAAAWFARQDDPASAAGQEELASESKLAWAMAHEALTLVKAVAEAASAMAEGMRSGDQAAEASPCAPLAHLIKSVLTSSSPGEAPAHWWIAILPGGSDLAAESVSVCCRAVLTTMRERPTDPRARDLWKALVSALAADAAEAAEEAPPGAENSVHAPDAVQEATLQGLKNVLMVAAADRLLGGGGADEAGLWDETWECLKAASAGLEASMRAELQPLFAPEAVAPASDRDGDDAGDASDTSQPDEEAATSEGPPSEVVRAGELPPVPASTGSGSPMPAQSASAEHAAPSSAAQGPLSAEPLAEDGASTPRPATPDSKGDDDATLAAMTDAGSPTAAPEQEADDDDADVDAGSGDDEEGAEGDGCAVM